MTTALDMIPAIGARVLVRCESLTVECTVRNVKNSWGNPRLLVAPVAGRGEQWVEMGRVTVPAPVSNIPENHATMHALGMCSRLASGCKACKAEGAA